MKFLILFSLAFLLFCGTAKSQVYTYYVDSVAGVDTNAGTLALPFKTLNAIPTLSPGNSVGLKKGSTFATSKLILWSDSGTSGNPITYGAYGSGANPIIDGTNTQTIAIQIGAPMHYITIQDISVKNTTNYGIQVVNGADHIVLNRVASTNSWGSGIDIAGCGLQPCTNSNNIIVSNCTISTANAGGTSSWNEGISMESVTTFSVTGCTVTGGGKEGIDAKYGSTAGVISGNTSTGNAGPNIYVDGSDHIQVFNNIAGNPTNTAKPNILMGVEYAANANHNNLHDINVFHNVAYGGNSGIAFFVESGAGSYANFTNINIDGNTFAGNHAGSGGGGVWLPGSNVGTGDTIRNNILFQNVSGGGKDIRDDATLRGSFSILNNFFGTSESTDTTGTNSTVAADPLLNGDYSLQVSSPARNHGVAIAGYSYSYGAPDIGAVNYYAQRGNTLTF